MRFVSLIALLAVAAPAMAQQTPAAQKPGAAADPGQEDKQICRRQQVTGSNFAKRECHTKAQWAQIDALNQENTARALDNRRAGSGRMN